MPRRRAPPLRGRKGPAGVPPSRAHERDSADDRAPRRLADRVPTEPPAFRSQPVGHGPTLTRTLRELSRRRHRAQSARRRNASATRSYARNQRDRARAEADYGSVGRVRPSKARARSVHRSSPHPTQTSPRCETDHGAPPICGCHGWSNKSWCTTTRTGQPGRTRIVGWISSDLPTS